MHAQAEKVSSDMTEDTFEDFVKEAESDSRLQLLIAEGDIAIATAFFLCQYVFTSVLNDKHQLRMTAVPLRCG